MAPPQSVIKQQQQLNYLLAWQPAGIAHDSRRVLLRSKDLVMDFRILSNITEMTLAEQIASLKTDSRLVKESSAFFKVWTNPNLF
jgi:hypothetical protein